MRNNTLPPRKEEQVLSSVDGPPEYMNLRTRTKHCPRSINKPTAYFPYTEYRFSAKHLPTHSRSR